MKLQITKQVQIKEEIDIELPFYFKQSLEDSVIYGKIEAQQIITIQEYDELTKFEVHVEQGGPEELGLGNYFTNDAYASTSEEFGNALVRVSSSIAALEQAETLQQTN